MIHSRYITMGDNSLPKLDTFELDIWSEPDEHHHVKHVGMKNGKETFEQLEEHLAAKGMLPDEYFLYGYKDEPLPDFDEAICHTNFGSSEGIYIDIDFQCRDESDAVKFVHFATGKTLGETADDFIRMSRIAAECSMILNGRGNSLIKTSTELLLDSQEVQVLSTALQVVRDNCASWDIPQNVVDGLVNKINPMQEQKEQQEQNTILNNDEEEMEI